MPFQRSGDHCLMRAPDIDLIGLRQEVGSWKTGNVCTMTAKRLLSLFPILFLLVGTRVSAESRASPVNPGTQSFLPLIRRSYNPKKGMYIVRFTPDPHGLDFCDHLKMVGATWFISVIADIPVCEGVEGVPAVITPENIGEEVPETSEFLATFNEPDLCGEWFMACLTPREAAVQFRRLESRYPNKKLTSPTVSGLNRGWREEFVDAYQEIFQAGGPPFEVIGFHCYASYFECIDHVAYYSDLAERWNVREVWVTEFSFRECYFPLTWADWTRDFITYLEAHPRVTRYAFFTNVAPPHWGLMIPGCNTPAIDWESGELTVYGQILRSNADE